MRAHFDLMLVPLCAYIGHSYSIWSKWSQVPLLIILIIVTLFLVLLSDNDTAAQTSFFYTLSCFYALPCDTKHGQRHKGQTENVAKIGLLKY